MSIYAIGVGVMLLLVQVYSASQKDAKNKIALWKAILMSVLWFVVLPIYVIDKSDIGGLSTSIKKLLKLPIA
jgi:hypothetical protein